MRSRSTSTRTMRAATTLTWTVRCFRSSGLICPNSKSRPLARCETETSCLGLKAKLSKHLISKPNPHKLSIYQWCTRMQPRWGRRAFRTMQLDKRCKHTLRNRYSAETVSKITWWSRESNSITCTRSICINKLSWTNIDQRLRSNRRTRLLWSKRSTHWRRKSMECGTTKSWSWGRRGSMPVNRLIRCWRTSLGRRRQPITRSSAIFQTNSLRCN